MDKNKEVMGTDLSFSALIKNSGVFSLRKIGINDASTFTGFCASISNALISEYQLIHQN